VGFELTSLLTSQVTNVLWLKDKLARATAQPRVAAGPASGTNLGKLGGAVMPSSACFRSTSKNLMSLMAISLSLVSPRPKGWETSVTISHFLIR